MPAGVTKKLVNLLPNQIRLMLSHFRLKRAFETEFELFSLIASERGMFLDIGANRGQAALSVLRRTRHFRVLSLEPNRALCRGLSLVRVIYPRRFRFHNLAAGREDAELDLYVPLGSPELTNSASLNRSEFDKAYVRERLACDGHDGKQFDVLRVTVCPVDSLGVQPDVVKIDVEGWEQQVLAGMEKTLKRCWPVLIIEVNNHQSWAPRLGEMGYRFFRLSENGLNEYASWAEICGLNVICIHPKSPPAVALPWLGGGPPES